MTIGRLAIALALLALAGCGREDPAVVEARAQKMQPASAPLAEIWQRSCRNCHIVRDSGAPMAGDAAAWQPRLAQGLETLTQHAMQGFKNMPARGLCPDCSQADFRALIAFMSAKP
jgi:cytochrome c5